MVFVLGTRNELEPFLDNVYIFMELCLIVPLNNLQGILWKMLFLKTFSIWQLRAQQRDQNRTCIHIK